MPESVLDIKNRVQQYKNVISRKEALSSEFQNWVELYKELGKVLTKVKAVYEMEKTEEAKLELDKWLKEEKDYLEIINEYAEKFREINEELSTYDPKTLDEQAEYLANITRFQELSGKMKEIEKRSKKLANGATIGTNCIKLENAEGRKKNIHEYFATEYMALSTEKRALSKVIKKQYNKLINQISEEKEELIEQTIPELLNGGENITQTTQPVVLDGDPAEKEYDNLTDEEKIIELEARMERIKKASGRKQRIKYRGETIELPRQYVGQYLMCASEVNKLRKNIEEQEKNNYLSSPFVIDMVATPVNNNSNIDISLDEPITNPVIDEAAEYHSDDLSSPFIKDATVTPNISSDKKAFDAENPGDVALQDLLIYERLMKVAKEVDLNEKQESKPKGFLKILNIKKPKVLENLKDKIKRALCVIAASAIIIASTIPAIIEINKLIKNSNDEDQDLSNVTTITEVETREPIIGQTIKNELVTTPTNPQPSFEIEEPVVEEEEAPIVEEETSIPKLGDSLNINDNVKIYNNMYDATLSRNGLNPQYNVGDLARTVGGMAINYEGQLYFFYANDSSAQSNIDTLLANGGEIKAVLASNEYGYEGFYNINDVNTLNQSLGGINR